MDAHEVVLGETQVTNCFDCSRPVVVHEDVAWDNNLKQAINRASIRLANGRVLTAYLEQTGGMCVACSIFAGDDESYYVYATLSEDWHAPRDGGQPRFWLGIYSQEDDGGGWDQEVVFEDVAAVAMEMLENAWRYIE